MKNIKYLLTLILCFVCAAGFAQQKRISGHVWSKSDGSIMMANVVEKDGNGRIISATQTDMSGNFSLTIKNPANKLEISYIGYQKKVLNIGAQSSFRVELLDRNTLAEAKVTQMRKTKSGGLTIPERELSTATQTLDMENMQGLSFETAGEALQGQIAGLDIVSNSGNLGAGTSMRLRGTSTINGNQEPLIVVDGYPLEGRSTQDLDLTDMDNTEQFATLLQVSPDDIKSECLLPVYVGDRLNEGKLGIRVLTTDATWFGMTYHEDRELVAQELKKLHGNGTYPKKLAE